MDFMARLKHDQVCANLATLETRVCKSGYEYVRSNREWIDSDVRELRPVDTVRKYRRLYDKGRITWPEFWAVKEYVMILMR